MIETNSLQTVWEVLNAALSDLQNKQIGDAENAIQECIDLLEALGVGQ